MADLEKTVAIIFEGVDNLSPRIKSLSAGIDKFAGNVSTATQPLADMADRVLKVETAMAALAAGGLALAIKTAGEFGDSFNEISTLIDVPADKLDVFRQNVLDYSRQSTSSIDEITGAIYSAISAGVDWEKSIEFLGTAEALATAGLADLNDTVKLLVGTMDAYGADIDEATRYSDVFFKTVEKGQTTIPEIAGSLAQVSSIAAAAGIPIETLMASIAALTAAGVPTEQAMTLVKGAITSIIKPSSDAVATADRLKIEFNAAAIASRGLEQVLWDAYEATGGNVEEMAKLFGNVRGLSAALTLGADESGKFAEALGEMRNASGATATALDKVAQNFANVNQTLLNNLQATLIEIGLPLLDDYADLAGQLSGVFESVSVGIRQDAFRPVFEALETFAGDISDFLNKVAESMPEALSGLDFSEFLESIGSLGQELQQAFNAFFGDIDLTTPEGLNQAMQKIVDSITALTNVTAGIIDAWEPFLRVLGEAVEKFADADASTQEITGRILGFGQAVNKVVDSVGVLTGALNVIAGALSILAGKQLISAVTSLSGFTGALGTAALALGKFAAAGAAIGVGWSIGSWLEENVPLVGKFTDTILKAADSILNFTGTQNLALLETSKQTEELGKQAVALVRLKESLGALPSQQSVEVGVQGGEQTEETFESILKKVQAVPFTKTIEAKAEVDEDSFERVEDFIVKELPNGVIEIIANPDKKSIDEAKAAFDEGLPDEEIIKIQLQGDIDKELAIISGSFDLLQEKVKFQAEIDIAQIEADVQKFEALMGGVETSLQSSADIIGDVLGPLSGAYGSQRFFLEDIIRKESRRRDVLIDAQVKLLEAQAQAMKARTEATQRGESMLTISADGLEPELEAFMWKIIEKVQIRAAEEDMSMLLGLNYTLVDYAAAVSQASNVGAANNVEFAENVEFSEYTGGS